jgi:hypothetical protein
MNREFFGFGLPVQLGLDVLNGVLMIVALIALLVSVWQIRREIRRAKETELQLQERYRQEDAHDLAVAREASAKDMYIEFLKMSLAHADLAIGKYNRTVRYEKEAYDSYLSMAMMSFEAILLHDPDPEGQWRLPIKYTMSLHLDALNEILSEDLPDDLSWRKSYDRRLIAIFDELMTQGNPWREEDLSS